LDKFKVSGFIYNESTKFQKNLSFRDIEKTLISFQTKFTVILIFYKKSKSFSKGNFIARASGIDIRRIREENAGESPHENREKKEEIHQYYPLARNEVYL